MRANPFTGFSSRRDHEKKGHYKKSQRGYISPICGEFPAKPNLTKICIWVVVAEVINRTKSGKDRSIVCKVTEAGGSNFGLLQEWLVAYSTVAHCSTTVLHVMGS